MQKPTPKKDNGLNNDHDWIYDSKHEKEVLGAIHEYEEMKKKGDKFIPVEDIVEV